MKHILSLCVSMLNKKTSYRVILCSNCKFLRKLKMSTWQSYLEQLI
uniref:Uncharacterized protein n=1 Tax=Rhizophora mucronata TaxID=61149 RepID=A0A2P2QAL9_RHIMU